MRLIRSNFCNKRSILDTETDGDEKKCIFHLQAKKRGGGAKRLKGCVFKQTQPPQHKVFLHSGTICFDQPTRLLIIKYVYIFKVYYFQKLLDTLHDRRSLFSFIPPFFIPVPVCLFSIILHTNVHGFIINFLSAVWPRFSPAIPGSVSFACRLRTGLFLKCFGRVQTILMPNTQTGHPERYRFHRLLVLLLVFHSILSLCPTSISSSSLSLSPGVLSARLSLFFNEQSSFTPKISFQILLDTNGGFVHITTLESEKWSIQPISKSFQNIKVKIWKKIILDMQNCIIY